MNLNKTPLRLLAMLAAGCALQLMHVPDARGQNPDTVNVKDFGAVGDGSKDDTAAISNAVNSKPPAGSAVLSVYFPAGTYRLSGAIILHSNMRLYGDGESSVISQRSGLSALQANGAASSPIFNITVERLGFLGAGGFQNSYGLSVSCGRDITFRNNSANSIPLFNIACGGTSNESLMSANVVVTNNKGAGMLGEGAAIMLQYLTDATVSDNVLSNYDHGIQYWGGNSATGETFVGVRRVTVTKNTIRNVGGAAVWGSEGSHITVTGNTAEGCGDVCLDAEASSDVTISGNVVRNAVNGGIATFYGSSGVVISSNKVVQETAFQKPAAHPGSSYAAIHIHGGNKDTNRVSRSLSISGNTLDISGISSAITTDQGALEDSTIQSNVIDSSSVGAAPIRILGGKNVDILANKISAVAATGISFEGPSRSSIMNNVIVNKAAGLARDTSKGGINIYWRSPAEPAQYNQIKGNTITGYPVSINDNCWGDNSSFNVIDNNSVDTIFHRGSGASYKGLISNNHANSNANVAVGGTGY